MDISNKTLALFLVAAIVLSVGGTMLSLNSLNKIGPTGLATERVGLVNLSIVSNADISVINATVDFGAGVVNESAGCENASVTNNGTGDNSKNCWVNQSWGTSVAVRNESSKWVVQNDGNVNVTLSMSSTQGNWTNFIGNCTNTSEQNWYMYSIFGNTSETVVDICQGALTSGAWTNWSHGSKAICTQMDYHDTKDAIAIALNITICRTNTPKGYKNDNVTFTAAAA